MIASLSSLTDAHLSWLELRRSRDTCAYYRHAHGRLLAFAATDGPPRLDRWTPVIADKYARWLAERGVKPVTVRKYVAALATLSRWAKSQEYLARDPLAGYTLPAGKAATVLGYRPEEVEAMLHACRQTPLGRRNQMVVLVLYDSGLRASELCALRLGDLDLAQGTALIPHGKGDKPRLVCFGERTATAIRRYVLRDHPAGEEAEAPLLRGRDGAPLSRFALTRVIVTLAEAAGLTGTRHGPHRLRHAFATQMLANGSNTLAVRELLGHSDQRTVEKYVNFLAIDLRAQHHRSSPVQHLSTTATAPAGPRGKDPGPRAAARRR